MAANNINIQVDVELNLTSEQAKSQIGEISKALKLASKDPSFCVQIPVTFTGLQSAYEEAIKQLKIEPISIELKISDEAQKNIRSFSEETQKSAKAATDSIRKQREETKKLNQETEKFNQNSAPKSSIGNYTIGNKADLEKTFETFEQAKKYIEGLNVGTVTESITRNAQQGIESFTLSIKAATGETEKLKFAWEQIDENDANKGFVYKLQNINEANAGVARLSEATKQWDATLEAARTKFTAAADTLKSAWRDSNGKDLLQNVDNVKKLDDEYTALINTIGTLENVDKAEAKTIIANIEAQASRVKDLTREYRSAEQAATDLRAKNPAELVTKYTNEVNAFKQKATMSGVISQMTAEIGNLETELEKFSTEKSKAQLTSFLNAFDIAKSKFKDENEIKKGFDNIELSANKAISSLRGFAGLDIFRRFANNADVQAFHADIDSLITDFQKLKETLKSGETSRTTEEYAKLKAQLDELIERFQTTKDRNEQLKYSLRDISAMEGARKSAKSLTNQINEYMAANTKAAKKYASEFQTLLGKLNMTALSGDASQVRVLTSEFESLKIRIAEMGDTGQTAFQRLGAAIKNVPVVGMYLSISSLAMRAVRNIREMINTVIDLDTQMTALKRVTNETSVAYDDFLKKAGKQAVQLHSSITDLIEQTTAWVKLGNSLEDASLLAENSMMFSRVADVDNETAVKNIVSTMKAFNIEAEDTIRIVDILDKLNNEFATSAADLGSGLAKTASSMAVAGNSLEKTVALLTGGTEITQNADEMATALRTISMRIRSMKGELQDLGEEYENVESLSKIQTQILNYTGVNIFDETGKFRDTYDILYDISKVYNDLVDTAKADLTEILFGKLRANQGAAILQAFQTGQIQKAYEAATNSAGTATEEFEKWSESIEAHIGSFTAASQALASNALDDRGIRNLVDAGTAIVQTIDDIVSELGTVKTLLPIIAGGLSVFKNIGAFRMLTDDLTGATNQLGLFGKTWDNIKLDLQRGFGARSFTSLLSKTDISVLQNYSKALQEGTITAGEFQDVLKNSSTSAQIMGKRIIELRAQVAAGTISNEQYGASVNAMVGAQNAATVSSKALGMALNAALNIGITLLISAIVQGIMQIANAEKEAIEKAKEAASEAKKEIEALEELYQSYIDIEQAVKDGIKSKQDLREATDTLIKRLGVERSAVHDLIQEYGDLDKALQYLTYQQIIQDILPDLKSGVQAAEEELLGVNGILNASNTINVPQKEAEFLDKWNASHGNVFERSTYADANYWIARETRGVTSLKDIEKEYETLIELRADLNREGLSESKAYKQVSDRISKIKPLYEAYTNAIEANNEQAAKAVVVQQNLTTELPNTFAEYQKYRQSMLDIAASDDYVNLFTGTAKDIEQAIINQLSSNVLLTPFEERLQNLEELSTKYIGKAYMQGASSVYEAQIRTFLDKLTDEDLEIATKIPDLFENGLKGASEKIAKWKGDPNNQLLDEEATKSLSEKIDEAAKKVKVITSAMQDMNDTGRVSSSTYKDIVEQGGNFTNALEFQNGMLVLNVDKLKELETQEYKNVISTGELRLAELKLNREREARKGGDWKSIQQMIEDLEAEIALNETFIKEIEEAAPKASGSSSTKDDTTDTTKDDFETAMREMEHLHAMGLKSDTEYYDKLEKENEEYFANKEKYESEYNSNIEKIYKGRQQIYKKAADDEISTLEDEYKRGIYTAEEYAEKLADVQSRYYGDSAQYYGTEFSEDEYKSISDKILALVDDEYSERLKIIEKANDHTLEAEKIYVSAFIALNEEMYQATNPKKYKDNLDEITEYVKGLDGVLDTYMEKWERLNQYDENDIESRNKRLAEAVSQNYSIYGDPNSELYNLDNYEQGLVEQAQYQLDTLKQMLDLGLIEYGEFSEKVGDIWRNTLDRNGQNLLDYGFVSGELDKSKQYDDYLNKLEKRNDKTIEAQEKIFEKQKQLNEKLFKAEEPSTYKANYEEIADNMVSFWQDLLGKGLITIEEYEQKVNDLFNEDSGVDLGKNKLFEWLNIDTYDKRLEDLRKANDKTIESEEKFIEDWKALNDELYYDKDNTQFYSNLKEITDYQLDLLKRKYDEGLISAKEYYDEVASMLSDVDVLGKDYVAEKLKSAWDVRVNDEENYWKKRKSDIEEAYDKEIEKLEQVKDETDDINKATELRLNLIKAQQKAEDAKKQRNQLIFENGTFRYDYDQEAVMSAEEEVAEAVKAIRDNQLTEQIDLLKEQKTAATEYYDNILEQISAYKDGTLPILESDSEVLSKILNSLPAQSAAEQEELILEEPESALSSDKQSVNKAISGEAALEALSDNEQQALNLFKALGVGNASIESIKAFSQAFNDNTANGIGKTFEKALAAAEHAETVYKSATTTNTITIGDIKIEVKGDTSEKMLIEFADQLGAAVEAKLAQYTYSNNK